MVKGILEDSTSYETMDDVAKALIIEIAKMISMRNMYVIYHKWPGGEKGLRIGPFGNLTEAKSFPNKVPLGGTGVILELISSSRLLANIEGYPGFNGYCSTCGHSPVVHGLGVPSMDDIYSAEFVNPRLGKCNLTDCSCMKWVDVIKRRRAAKKKGGEDHD